MKILFITTMDLQIHTFHERIIHQLKEQGHTVDAVTNGYYTDTNHNYTNPDLDHKYTVPFSRNPLKPDNIKARNTIRKLIQENQYDIISCHSPVAGFFGRMAARGLDVRVLYTAHGFHFWKGAPAVNTVVFKNMERLAAHWTDTIMTINPEDYEAASRFRYKKGGGPVLIPGVGVDVHHIKSLKCGKGIIRQELGLPEDAFVMYSVGEMIKRKNHIFVLNSLREEFHRDPKLHYVIAGFGKLEPELKKFVSENGLENQVHILGFRKDARRLMYGMDLFLFPSYQEGLPVAVMEAMSAGLPCIVSDIRGSHDLILNGENGFVYPVDDTEKFLEAFRRLRSDAELRDRFSRKVLEDAEQYSVESVEPQILALYRK
ncbi:MAG: glycosyltransferase family 4 protein [Solobacterium sp.]|nr:glycosyltransferase family 4 protein [Solobacterium sp.]